ENALRDVHAVGTQIQVAGDRPAAREGGAEHLGADQDCRAQHGQHTLPRDPAIAAGACRAVHVFILWAAIWAKGLAESRLAGARFGRRNKVSQQAWRKCREALTLQRAQAASRAFVCSRPASTSAARMRSISASESLTSGGRTTARGSRPSSTSA